MSFSTFKIKCAIFFFGICHFFFFFGIKMQKAKAPFIFFLQKQNDVS